MSIETDLFSTLDNDSALTTLLASRIFPNLAKKSAALPCIVYTMVGGTRFETLAGVGDTKKKEMQISCFDRTYAKAKIVADAVLDALDGGGHLNLEVDFYDDETQTHSVVIDWSFIQ